MFEVNILIGHEKPIELSERTIFKAYEIAEGHFQVFFSYREIFFGGQYANFDILKFSFKGSGE